MQAYAEGFQILKETDAAALPAGERFNLDVAGIAEIWRHGSIVSSRLLDVIASALGKDKALQDFSGVVEDTGEGRWTIQTAIERAIPAMALTTALNARFRSRREGNFADKLISAMRHGFGGHAEPRGKA
jgi:6-phosphogluconate dehydrogenase